MNMKDFYDILQRGKDIEADTIRAMASTDSMKVWATAMPNEEQYDWVSIDALLRVPRLPESIVRNLLEAYCQIDLDFTVCKEGELLYGIETRKEEIGEFPVQKNAFLVSQTHTDEYAQFLDILQIIPRYPIKAGARLEETQMLFTMQPKHVADAYLWVQQKGYAPKVSVHGRIAPELTDSIDKEHSHVVVYLHQGSYGRKEIVEVQQRFEECLGIEYAKLDWDITGA